MKKAAACLIAVLAVFFSLGAARVDPQRLYVNKIPREQLSNGFIYDSGVVVPGFGALRLLTDSAPAMVHVAWGATPGDGLGGDFWQDPTDVATPDDDSNTIVAGTLRWKLRTTLGADFTFLRGPPTQLRLAGTNTPNGLTIDYDPNTQTAHISSGVAGITNGTGQLLYVGGQQAIGVGVKAGSVQMFAGPGSSGADAGDTTVEAGIATGGGNGGNYRIAGGDSNLGRPGFVEIVGGNGPASFPTGRVFIGYRNLILGQGATGWADSDDHGMVGGIFIHEATSAPTSNAQAGGHMYIDPADHKLKFRGQNGTITTLASP